MIYYLLRIIKHLLVHKKIAFFVALGYTIALTAVSLVSVSGMPDFEYSNADKIYHFIAYFFLSSLWFVVLFKRYKLPFYKSLLYSVVASILFGIIIEVLQAILTDYRSADYMDVLANTIGVSTTVITLLILKKKVVKK